MNKLSKKFIIGIICILVLSSFCSILFNTRYLERFYLFQKRNSINQISDEFAKLLEQETFPQEAVKQIESSYKVIIAEIDSMPTDDDKTVNEKIQSAFQKKGIGFQKYWFWKEDYKKVLEGEQRIKLYEQKNLNYSLLIDYMKEDSTIYAITMIVPNPDKPEKLFLFSTPCVILKKKGVFICYSLINTLIKFMASLPVMTA